MDTGAPLPHLLTDGQRAVLLFHAGLTPDPDWDGTTVTIVDAASPENRHVSWVIFDGVYLSSLGPPNNEALAGHPLYGAGLGAYRAHEVHNSDLVRTLEELNRVHRHHRSEAFDALHHLIVTFHDETFECLCRSWETGVISASFPQALGQAVQSLRVGPAAFS